jgi:TP901 family phage tail tape measure protein
LSKAAVAQAYVQILPTTDGITKALNKEFAPAGQAAGEDFGNSFGSGLSTTTKVAFAAVGVAAAAAFVGFAGFVRGGITEAEALNLKLREVVTLTGETGTQADKSFGEFADLVRAVSDEFGIAQTVLTGGLYSALSAGVPKENALTFLQVASQAAIGGVTDVETAVDGITTVLNAFGLEASSAEAVSDSLFTAVKGGKTTFEELSGSLFNVGPAAAAAGVSFEEVNAAIAALTAAGVPTSVATTQIRAALVGLQRPSEDLNAVFQALGYENAQLAIESEGLQFALNAVKDASGGSNGALQTLLGSVEAVGAVNVLAGTGAEKFTAELEAQANAVGATAAAFEEVDKGRNSERLEVALENLSISLGEALLPIFEDVTAFLQSEFVPFVENTLVPAFEDVSAFIKDEVVPAFDEISAWVTDNVPTIATFVGVLGGLLLIFNAAAIATKLWAVAQGILNAVMLMNPLTLVAIAVAALVAGIVYLATQTTFFQDIWEAMTNFVTDAWQTFVDFFESLVESIGNFFSGIVTGIQDAWDITMKRISGAIEYAVAFIRAIWDKMVEGVNSGMDNVRSFFENVWNGVTKFFRGVINGYIGLFESFFNFVIDGVNGLIRALNKIKIDVPATPFTSAFTIGLNLPTIPRLSIPRLAEGGYVDQATLAIIGEAGPEVVTPLRDFERMMNLGEGKEDGKTLNYYAAPNESIDSEAALFEAMRRARVVAQW